MKRMSVDEFLEVTKNFKKGDMVYVKWYADKLISQDSIKREEVLVETLGFYMDDWFPESATFTLLSEVKAKDKEPCYDLLSEVDCTDVVHICRLFEEGFVDGTRKED